MNEIFGRVDTLARLVQNMRDGHAGRLVLASAPTLVNTLLPRAVAQFRARRPAVTLAIRSLPTPQVVELLARRRSLPELLGVLFVHETLAHQPVGGLAHRAWRWPCAGGRPRAGDQTGRQFVAVVTRGASTSLPRKLSISCSRRMISSGRPWATNWPDSSR